MKFEWKYTLNLQFDVSATNLIYYPNNKFGRKSFGVNISMSGAAATVTTTWVKIYSLSYADRIEKKVDNK